MRNNESIRNSISPFKVLNLHMTFTCPSIEKLFILHNVISIHLLLSRYSFLKRYFTVFRYNIHSYYFQNIIRLMNIISIL